MFRYIPKLRLNSGNQSDMTTVRHIFDQIERRIVNQEVAIEIFDAMVDVAKECACRGKNPKAMFVQAMKEPRFGYVPEHRRLIGGKI